MLSQSHNYSHPDIQKQPELSPRDPVHNPDPEKSPGFGPDTSPGDNPSQYPDRHPDEVPGRDPNEVPDQKNL